MTEGGKRKALFLDKGSAVLDISKILPIEAKLHFYHLLPSILSFIH